MKKNGQLVGPILTIRHTSLVLLSCRTAVPMLHITRSKAESGHVSGCGHMLLTI